MRLAPIVLLAALAQPKPAAGPLASWKLEGSFVREQAIYDARSAETHGDLCRAHGVEQEGLLVVRNGELRYVGDAECWDVPFRAERVAGEYAVGAFERPALDCSPQKRPCAGNSCVGRWVQIWREGDTLVVRGAFEALHGTYGLVDEPLDELETTVVRFVPIRRLEAEEAPRAARLGVDLAKCGKTVGGAGPPRR